MRFRLAAVFILTGLYALLNPKVAIRITQDYHLAKEQRKKVIKMARNIDITEYEDEVVIQFKPQYTQYSFESWEAALEALPNLEEYN